MNTIGPIRPIRRICPIILRPSLLHEAELFAAWEEDPDTAPHILPYTLDQHREAMTREDLRYLTLLEASDGEPVGYMILLPDGAALGLKRWVIGPKGSGYGGRSLSALIRYGGDEGYTRLWLDVFADNARARHLYEKAGFQETDELDFFGRRLLVYEKNLQTAEGEEKDG